MFNKVANCTCLDDEQCEINSIINVPGMYNITANTAKRHANWNVTGDLGDPEQTVNCK